MRILLLGAAIAAIATTAAAAPRTVTRSLDTARLAASRTSVLDREAGTLSRDASVTRKSDGAVATSSFDRARTDAGVTASGSRTGFEGATASFDFTRTRTDDGYTSLGTATARSGATFTSAGSGTRTETGFTREQTVNNAAGETVYSRSVTTTRRPRAN